MQPPVAGQQLPAVTFSLERSKLAELARALGDDDPLWHDTRAAAAAGFDGVPVPPTYTVLADHWRPGGLVGAPVALGLDLARLLHGEAAWELLRPARLGDELTAAPVVERVEQREGRRGGTMTLLTIATTFTDRDGDVVARLRDTWIETAGR